MASLLNLKKSREGYRTNAKKQVKVVADIWDGRATNPPDADNLAMLRDCLQKYGDKINDLNDQIASKINDDDFDAEHEKCLELQDLIWKCQSQLVVMLDAEVRVVTHGDGSQYGSVNEAAKSVKVKLPKLNLPKFDGDPLGWQEFWDCFESTIHIADMPGIDKFKYLKESLVGDAAKVVGGYRLIEANYGTVIEVLHERFGNKEVAIFAHFERLLALQQSSNETQALQATYDGCENQIRSLVALGLQEDTFGLVFSPIILSKLPRPVRVGLHRQNGSKPWTLANLRELLRDEIKARQMGDWTLGDREKSKDKPKQSHNQSNQKQQNNSKPHPPSTSTFVQNSKGSNFKISCVFCSGSHYSDSCQKVTGMEDRKAAILSSGRCFKCFSTQHLAKACTNQPKCRHCNVMGHATALCRSHYGKGSPGTGTFYNSAYSVPPQGKPGDRVFTDNDQSIPRLDPQAPSFTPTVTKVAASNGSIYMQMAVVQFSTPDGPVSARIFLDSGSSCCYITERSARELRLCPAGETTVSNARFEEMHRRIRSYPYVSFGIPTVDGSSVTIQAFVTPAISAPLQKLPLDRKRFPILEQVVLADPLCDREEVHDIDILLGSDVYYDFVGPEQIRLGGGLVLLGSKLGYLTAGRVVGSDSVEPVHNNFVVSFLNYTDPFPKLHNNEIERLWSLEDIGVKDDAYSKDDDRAVKMFNDTVVRGPERYEVRWPYVDGHPELPSNYRLSHARLKHLAKRIQSQPDILKMYGDTIQQQVQDGVIEEVPLSEIDNPLGKVHYLPHHGVIRMDKATTKLRIVYDASSKTEKTLPSLNDCLLRGPVLLADLCGLLLRFRTHRIAMVSDIAKAFLQVGLQLQDRDVTRFLWLKDPFGPVCKENIIIYRFTRVPFGVISSPFLLAGTIEYHMVQQETATAKHVAGNMYVDNAVCGMDTVDDSKSFYGEAKELFRKISMNLREWFTNSAAVRDLIAVEDRGNGIHTKVLGMNWNTELDTIGCSDPKISAMVVSTKRQLLQAGSRVFDPCGLFAPIVVSVKILIQEVWKRKVDWDAKIPPDLIERWEGIRSDMTSTSSMAIPRWIFGGKSWDLHCFCDASAKAYAAVVYVRSDEGKVNLLMCKTKLAPVKPVTMPRLELMAVVIGTRLVQFVKGQLALQIGRIVVWTDSKCVLHWIASSRLLSVFVANRVREIKTHPYDYRYVPTDLNPADIPSKGCSLLELKVSSLWWGGPRFLMSKESEWPVTNLGTTDEEARPLEVGLVISNQRPSTIGPFGIDISKYSTLYRLLSTTAWMARFVNNVRARKSPATQIELRSTLQAYELTKAKLAWTFHAQLALVDKDFENLKKQLDLFQYSDGLWRCGGRLQNADIPNAGKFPVLLPKSHPFTILVIKQCHTLVHHMGVRQTLSELRSQFWIPWGKSQVKAALKGCPVCAKWEGSPFKTPRHPPLPNFRVSQSIPFAYTGVDYMGPLLVVGDNRASAKVWICLFTCAATRAIHLEVVPDLTTEQFLLSLRRFTAMCGQPKCFISDNGKYFKLAHNVLTKLWNSMVTDHRVQGFAASKEIEWKFIPEYSPWMGGFYERLVGSVKRCLKKVLGRKSVSLPVLQTLVTEVAAVVNSRPLVSSDHFKDHTLTPSDLIGRKRSGGFQFGDSEEPDDPVEDQNRHLSGKLVAMWQQRNAMLNLFWNVWKSDYLTALRETHRRVKGPRGSTGLIPMVGSVVLIGSKSARSNWPMGIIVRLSVSSDGIARSAHVRLPSGKEVNRPVKILFPIEVEHLEKSNTNYDGTICHADSTSGSDGTICHADTKSQSDGTICHADQVNSSGDGNICHTPTPTTKRSSVRKAAKLARSKILSQIEEEMSD